MTSRQLEPAPLTTTPAAEFDALYASQTEDADGIAKVLRIVEPTLPAQIEPFSFLSADLLHHLSDALALRDGDMLADLGCGRGGPGLWLTRASSARLVGVDFSVVAATQARQRAAALGMHSAAQFVVADLTATGLADHAADAVLSIDAMQYAADRTAAAGEARRILRPGGRLVLTGWHPRRPGDQRLPERHRTTYWPANLRAAGFTSVRCVARPAWTDTYVRIYRVALDLGSPGNDLCLAGLQDEAARRLPTAHLLRRVMITAVA